MRAEAGLEVESSLVLREADFDWAWKEVKSQVEKQMRMEKEFEHKGEVH